MKRVRAASAFGLTASTLAVAAGVAAAPTGPSSPRILVFTKTTGFRHASIPAAVRAIRELGAGNNLAVDATENSAAFTSSNLARYGAVVFLMTTGDVLTDAQQDAFQRYFRAGGGFAGVHSAADTEYGWAWYGRMLGTYFKSHPEIQTGSIDVERRRDPSTVGLPRRWTRTDEWYSFARNPRQGVRVLATLDESSYAPGNGAMGGDHPIAWSHAFQGGRAWYTGGGHTDQSYSEALFRRHLLGGIRYAAGLSPPRIVSLGSRVRSGRVEITMRYTGCDPCRGVFRINASRVPIRVAGGRGTAKSPKLPRGRWNFTVALADRVTGLADSARRSVRVG